MPKQKKETPEEPLEKKLWRAADKLRKNMDAAEYKHIVLGLIFLKYISDAFEELHSTLLSQVAEGADAEDKNEYTAEKVFYVPPSSRWTWLQGRAKLPTIGKDVDDAMDAIEKDNPSLRGVLPKVFAQEKLDKASLGGLIDMFATTTLGTKEARSKDILGKVYEYFLGQFALAEGKKGGQFYTPASVVKLLVEMLEPYAHEIKESDREAEKLGLSTEEVAFYYALEVNDSAVKVLGDETLRVIAKEIADKVRTNATIDWTIRESARARLMVIVKRTLTKYGYPPDKQQKAIDTVLKQAELMADGMVLI